MTIEMALTNTNNSRDFGLAVGSLDRLRRKDAMALHLSITRRRPKGVLVSQARMTPNAVSTSVRNASAPGAAARRPSVVVACRCRDECRCDDRRCADARRGPGRSQRARAERAEQLLVAELLLAARRARAHYP